MKYIFKTILIFSLFVFNLSAQSTIVYEGTDEIIFNPERGFSAYRSNPVTINLINTLKAQNISVIQRIYTILNITIFRFPVIP